MVCKGDQEPDKRSFFSVETFTNSACTYHTVMNLSRVYQIFATGEANISEHLPNQIGVLGFTSKHYLAQVKD